MLKLHAFVLERHMDAVTGALGASGCVHLVGAAEQSREHLLQPVSRAGEIQKLDALFQKCRELLASLDIREPELHSAPAPDAVDPAAEIDRVWKAYQEEETALGRLAEEEARLTGATAVLADFPFLGTVPLAELRRLHHLHAVFGRVPAPAVPTLAAALGGQALVLHEEDRRRPGRLKESRVLVIGAKKNRFAMENRLTEAGFRPEALPAGLDATGEEERTRAASRLAELRQETAAHRQAVAALAAASRGGLLRAWSALARALGMARAQQQYGRSAELVCLSGWLPAARREEARRLVEEAAGGLAVVRFLAPEADERVRAGVDKVPVKFAGPAVLAPFQELVKIFGVPQYDEVEPSLFLALSFLLMFGMMFGDVGQGLVLALAGAVLLGLRRGRAAGLRGTAILLLAGGLSASLFGFLYGSVFGYEGLLPPLWGAPLERADRLFLAGIGIGVVYISTGVLLNVTNKLAGRQYFDGVWDKTGVLGLVLYWGAIGLAVRAWLAGGVSGTAAALVIGLPLLLIALREPLVALRSRRRSAAGEKTPHEDPFTLAFMAVMEVFETVTTFLGNTISFIRVGAFALSHAALCLTIYALGDMVRNLPGGGLWWLLVVAGGNLLVIALEGMIVTIQCLRLQYYEFFSKFFRGDGVLYQPFRLAGEPPAAGSGGGRRTG